jgi:hypothetical protein
MDSHAIPHGEVEIRMIPISACLIERVHSDLIFVLGVGNSSQWKARLGKYFVTRLIT